VQSAGGNMSAKKANELKTQNTERSRQRQEQSAVSSRQQSVEKH